MAAKLVIHWFRQDLRLSDNPALSEAASAGRVLPIYILDDDTAGPQQMGGASRCWLHHSLGALNDGLDGRLRVYRGRADEVIAHLCAQYPVSAVYWNRCYEPWRTQRDQAIKSNLQQQGIGAHSHKAALLWEPWETLKKDGTPYKVFTPYYRKGCLNAAPVPPPIAAPTKLTLARGDFGTLDIDQLDLLPGIGWEQPLMEHWQPGEAAATRALQDFIDDGLADYQDGRNFPARDSVSRLSPCLHWGEISPRQVWHAVDLSGDNSNVDHFKSELGWREFSYTQLYYFPELPHTNLQGKFDHFPWRRDEALLRCWQRGQTGYPIVDAGMRELWQTGYMHGRVRMIVGSFLVKNLLLHWHHGEAWFWDCLLDADLASNSASWQWIAGCGADAAPYFRIFNPVTQGEKFDRHGNYTRRYVPELSALPDKYLFQPWTAPAAVLAEAGVELGKTYPRPVVDLKESREMALAAFRSLREMAAEKE
ncbi:MAG: deoxyribodipyrimidine photo-lyase [Gammaproteobacteria bacterium]|nr:deoxyribodipyrimidine photo-lyase [Gammaproteobacteria bacterium]